jgi:hypothetical protein
MANPEHLEILKQGVRWWNKWREEQPEITPDLNGAYLIGAELDGAHFSGADLSSAVLVEADLSYADLRAADLSHAHLSDAKLIGAHLGEVRFRYARLRYADLRGANFSRAHLSEADLTEAELSDADFRYANLGYTTFGDNDLSQVKGLVKVRHHAPSIIGISTIYRSQGIIPEVFLRGCGVPEDFITYARSLVTKPIEFYSCFISYSSKDQEFAERLHDDLQAKGVRIWFAPHDMRIGARIRPTIDESIRTYDKLLIVLSENSVGSQWVEQEVETALAGEREQEGKTVLFPIRVDDAIMEMKSGWPALLKNTRNVGDFTRWKDHDSYRKAFDRLLRDLKAEAKH